MMGNCHSRSHNFLAGKRQIPAQGQLTSSCKCSRDSFQEFPIQKDTGSFFKLGCVSQSRAKQWLDEVSTFVLDLASSSFQATRHELTRAVGLPGTYSILFSLPLVDDMSHRGKSEPPSPVKRKPFVSWNMKDDGEGFIMAP